MKRENEADAESPDRGPPDGAEALLLQCLQAGNGLPSALDALRASGSAEAARAARLLGMLDEVGFLHEPGTLEPGLPERIGGYRILSLLGTGGMGTVYLAEHEQLGRRVALKVIHRELAATEKAQARFRREAMAASRLDHPGICTVYEVGRDGGQAFLAMRHVPGRDLATHLAESRWQQRAMVALPGPEAGVVPIVRFVAKAALALHAAHEAGLVHRDVKPGNLMVTPAGEPVLLDFGLALAADSEVAAGALTLSGDRIGTPVYMAPEQVAGQRADRRADVYALGVVMYECLTGEPPFREVNRESLFRAILSGDVPDARRANRAIGRELWTVLQTSLAREPERRYATAAAFAEDLRRVAGNLPILAKRPGALLRMQRFAQRNPVVATLLAGLVVVASVLGWMWRERGDALAQRDGALEQAKAVVMALRATDGREGPVPSLVQAIAGYEKAANVDTLSALYAATLRCREGARLELDTFPNGPLPSEAHFAPDGTQFLIIGFDGCARLVDLQGRIVGVFRHDQLVNTAVFSPDGQQILTASMDGTAAVWARSSRLSPNERLWTLRHGEPVRGDVELSWIDPGSSHCVLWADWSPDGKRIATGCSDRSVQFWDPATGDRVGEALRDHQGPPMRHAWSADSSLLASAECDARAEIGLGPARVLVYGTDPSHPLLATLEHPLAVHSVEFTRDASHLVTACADGLVRVFALPGGAPEVTISLGGVVCNVDLSRDGERILACSTNGVAGIWRRDGSLLRRRTFDVGTWVQFTADDRILGHGPANGVLLLDDELREQQIALGHSHECYAITMSPNGRHIATTSQDMTARVWSVVDPDMSHFLGHTRRVVGLAVLPDGSVLSISEEGVIKLWDARGQLLRSLAADSNDRIGVARNVAVDVAGGSVAVPCMDGVARVLDLSTASTVASFPALGPGGRGCAVAWTNDGRLAIGGVSGKELAIYAMHSGLATKWTKTTNGVVKAIATAHRRQLLFAAGWNGKVAMWRQDGTFVGELETGFGSWFEALAVSPDESLLAAAGGERSILLWRLRDAGLPEPLMQSPLQGHDSSLRSLAWSPDGRWLASGSRDGAVRLWDTGSWKAVAVLRGHDRGGTANAVNCVEFTRDSAMLLTAGDDGAIQAWPTDPARLLEIARRKVARLKEGTPGMRHLEDSLQAQDRESSLALAGRLVDDAIHWGDWRRLNRIAWRLVDPAVNREPLAIDHAERAIRASFVIRPEPDADRLDTLARVLFWNGDYAGALAEQRKAVAMTDRPDLRAALEEYEKLIGDRR